MISMKEILGDHNISEIPIEQQHNLEILLERVNKIRELWGKAMTVTSGYRSMQEHLVIYSKKGIFPPNVPMKSHHLYGEAVDISDPDLELTKWLKDTPQILEDAELWCENGNKNWVHFQIVPPRSGVRWFLP